MINMDNYEGYLYLYQEGELDSTTRTEVERFLLEHPDIREEMALALDCCRKHRSCFRLGYLLVTPPLHYR